MAYVSATAAAALKVRLEAEMSVQDDAQLTKMCNAIAAWITDWLPTLVVTTTGVATGVTSGGATAPTASTGGVT